MSEMYEAGAGWHRARGENSIEEEMIRRMPKLNSIVSSLMQGNAEEERQHST
ncbi:hypothetical protein PanWU01x14_143880 [Parasponia andersonii]|uniref:Uncharacterized protein n=1 Tax=Parasponia andersonii TaxID=3476 RepID=A0A2P5CL25_PARAD|nr:hypothetical protein PanWU01x14_143880 [Parasponia andersonii]